MLLSCVMRVLLALLSISFCGALHTLDGSDPRSSRLQTRSKITFNTLNFGMPHSMHNFNPHSSSLIAQRPVFRPTFPNDNFFLRPSSFNRPSFPSENFNVPRIETRPIEISFGNANNKGHLPSTFTSSNINLSTGDPATVSSPTTSLTSTTRVITDVDRKAPIMFGVASVVPVHFSTPLINSQKNARPQFAIAKISSTISPTTPSGETKFTGFGHTSNNFNIETITTELPAVFFPGISDRPTQSPIEDKSIAENDSQIDYNNDCILQSREAIFEGNCSVLLHQGPCSSGHWLVMSEENGTAYCSERQCPWDRVYYEEECVNPQGFEVCRRGQILYVDITGYAECDCEPDYIYDPKTQNCYTEHEQGYCNESEYLERDENMQLSCVHNPCGLDGYVNDENGQCFVKNYIGRCPVYQIDFIHEVGTADCLTTVPHSIFEVPTLRSCPPGSRRDFFHKCRTVFRVPTQTSFPSIKGQCPDNYLRGPRGACRKVISLFG